MELRIYILTSRTNSNIIPPLFLQAWSNNLFARAHKSQRRSKSCTEKENRRPTIGKFLPWSWLHFLARLICTPDSQWKLPPLFERMKNNSFNVFLTSWPYLGGIQLPLGHAAKIEILTNEEDIKFYIKKVLPTPTGETPLSKGQMQ